LGVQVTVVENRNDILMTEDKDIRKQVKKLLHNRGVDFITAANIDIDSITAENGTVTMTFEKEGSLEHISAEKILVSVGRKANIDDIGLTNTSIEIKNHAIVTNDMYQTAESHIYAIGDCIGGMQLAHVASSEAIIAVEHMADKQPLP